MSKTVAEHIEELSARFRALSPSRKASVLRAAKRHIADNPGAANHSTFWRGLSARQVVSLCHAKK